jgi:hypothetical protein
MLENNGLRRIFKKRTVLGEWRKLHNDKLDNLCCSPDIIKVIKSRTMSYAKYIAHMRKIINVYKIVKNLAGKNNLGVL